MEQGWLESGKKMQGVGRKMPLQNRSQNQKMPDRALRQTSYEYEYNPVIVSESKNARQGIKTDDS